jgi:microcystin-dependent protein
MADLGAGNWNESDSGNNTAAPDGAPEGMAPSGVNDVLRAVMGAQKRFYNWQSIKQTAGSATAYTLNYGVAPGALVDGMTHLVEFHAANGNAATLNVNSLGAKPLHYYSAGAWRAVPAALFDVNQVSLVAYNASAGAYRLLDVTGDTGEVKSFAGAAVPAGYLLAFGQAISRTNYAGLFAVCGTTYGVGDGSTTFNLPDLRGRVAAGKDNMGGSAAGRLSGGTTLGAALGAETHTHGGSTMDGPNSVNLSANGLDFNAANVVHTHALHIASDTNVQPTFIFNLMIRI